MRVSYSPTIPAKDIQMTLRRHPRSQSLPALPYCQRCSLPGTPSGRSNQEMFSTRAKGIASLAKLIYSDHVLYTNGIEITFVPDNTEPHFYPNITPWKFTIYLSSCTISLTNIDVKACRHIEVSRQVSTGNYNRNRRQTVSILPPQSPSRLSLKLGSSASQNHRFDLLL